MTQYIGTWRGVTTDRRRSDVSTPSPAPSTPYGFSRSVDEDLEKRSFRKHLRGTRRTTRRRRDHGSDLGGVDTTCTDSAMYWVASVPEERTQYIGTTA